MKFYLLVLLCLAAMIAYIQRLAFAICEQQIREDLTLDKPQIGQIIAAWQLGYALLQLPSGWFADRVGSRHSLTLFIVLWSGLLGAMAWCTSFSALIVCWGAMGMAQAGVFPCATKLIGEWFGADKRATASGFLASSMALGIALAPLLTTQLLAAGTSWQNVLLIYVLPGWLWAGIFLSTTRDATARNHLSSAKLIHDTGTPTTASAPVVLAWGALLTSIPMWLLCGQQFFRAAAMMFFQSWFPTFLRETRNVDLASSGWLAFVVGLGALLGGMTGGIVSDWILSQTGRRRLARQGIAMFGMLACAALIGISYFVSDTTVAIGCISLGAYLATFGGVSGYTMAIDLGGQHVATAFSLMNMCGNIGAALFPLLVGYISTSFLGWDGVLGMCVLILIVDAVCWAMLNPTHALSGERIGA